MTKNTKIMFSIGLLAMAAICQRHGVGAEWLYAVDDITLNQAVYEIWSMIYVVGALVVTATIPTKQTPLEGDNGSF